MRERKPHLDKIVVKKGRRKRIENPSDKKQSYPLYGQNLLIGTELASQRFQNQDVCMILKEIPQGLGHRTVSDLIVPKAGRHESKS